MHEALVNSSSTNGPKLRHPSLTSHSVLRHPTSSLSCRRASSRTDPRLPSDAGVHVSSWLCRLVLATCPRPRSPRLHLALHLVRIPLPRQIAVCARTQPEDASLWRRHVRSGSWVTSSLPGETGSQRMRSEETMHAGCTCHVVASFLHVI